LQLFRQEEVFFQYFSYHGRLDVQNDSKNFHFDIGGVLSLKGEGKMKTGALYRLDVVGILAQDNKKKYN